MIQDVIPRKHKLGCIIIIYGVKGFSIRIHDFGYNFMGKSLGIDAMAENNIIAMTYSFFSLGVNAIAVFSMRVVIHKLIGCLQL